jgi:hypothetical protein
MKKITCILMLLISGFLAESCISYLLSRERKKEFEAYVSVNGEMCTYEKNVPNIFDMRHRDHVDFYLPDESREHAKASISFDVPQNDPQPRLGFSLEIDSDSDCFYTNTRYTDLRGPSNGISFNNKVFSEFLEGSWVKFSYPSETSSDVFFYIDFEYVFPSDDSSGTMLINGHFIVYKGPVVEEDWIRSILKNKL